jgi:hypothetical protein
MKEHSQIQLIAWALASTVTVVAIIAWLESLDWQIGSISAFTIFPVLGIVAFSLMWTHYIVGAIRRLQNTPKTPLIAYFRVTSIIVLVAILLHPALLMNQLRQNLPNLTPPQQIEAYIGSGLVWAVSLGTISLVIFLLFELHRLYSDKTWWKYIEYANVAAMFAIFIHGLKIGTVLQTTWFRGLWYFYGISLIVALIYIYNHKTTNTKS